MLTISGRAVGRKKPLFADWSVPFPPDLRPDGDRLTLRDLIARVVRAEVAAFKQRQQERQLFRALTEGEIAQKLLKGKVESGGSEAGKQEVDEEQAVAVALEAFADGLYLVVVDDEEQRDLDREVYLKPDSRLTFIRLTMLAGG
jgi:hypothetical protein